jgi:hypothetical protein
MCPVTGGMVMLAGGHASASIPQRGSLGAEDRMVAGV